MQPLIHWWQSLPAHVNSVIFSVGAFSLHWYSVMYILALATVHFLVSWRIRRGEVQTPPDAGALQDLIFTSVIGIILGGRLGYVLVYDPTYYLHHPLEILLPFGFQGGFHYTGFSGMSFHGGLIGVLVVFAVFCRRRQWPLWEVLDNLAPAVPLGYTFGRLGNFINGELYGRVTASALGMRFPTAPTLDLRYPSQLFEALGEGLLLFAALWSLRNRRPFPGFLSACYLFGYGLIRFCVEFTRQPDPQLGFILGPLSMGQLLCLLMMAAAAGLWAIQAGRAKGGSV
jgi:phosphatidylglycerol:prolipoprotein diacylglycerol transferase